MKYWFDHPEVKAIPSSRGRTVRMIWNETPFGCAILDKGYLALCDLIERKAARSLPLFARVVDIWGMTPREAAYAVTQWHDREAKLNPDFLKEYKAEILKDYIAD